MKKLLLLFVAVLLAGCSQPIKTEPVDPVVSVYTPPLIDGSAETRVLRAPAGMVISRNIQVEEDPLYGACNEPGTVYVFYEDGALVQYLPEGYGGYPRLAMTIKLTVEAHNSVNAEENWWNYVSVSAPGFIFDYSHDPVCPPLTIQIRTNDGELALNGGGGVVDYLCADAAEYASLISANGMPKTTLRLTFESFGASDGVTVIHMNMGGDGLDILPSTFHF